MNVIRKRLYPDEGAPPQTRYDPETDSVQTTSDGGITWTQNDGADPRKNTAYQMPPNTETNVKCAAAAGMVEDVTRVVNAGIVGGTVVGIGAILLALLVLPIGWLYLLVLAVSGGLLTAGGTALAASFTQGVYDQLLCIFYNNIASDGSITGSQWTNVLTDVDSDIGDALVYSTLELVFKLHGAVGLSNAGTLYADGEADCSPCAGWTYCWLDGDGLGDWVTPVALPDDARSAGSYNSGTDAIDGTVINAEGDVWANFKLTESLNVNGVLINYTYDNTDGDSAIAFFVDDSFIEYGAVPGGTGSTNYTYEGDIPGLTSISFRFPAHVSMSVTKIKLAGYGTEPASGVACE